MIYHTMRTWYTQFCRTRPYTQIHSLITKILNIKITPSTWSLACFLFGLLSVDNLALQLIKLVWSLYILQTVHAKGWMSPGCKWQLHTKHKCSSSAISSGTWWIWPEHETLPVQVSPHRRALVYRGTMHCPNFVNFIFKSLNPQKPKGLKINLHYMLLSKKVRTNSMYFNQNV